MYRRPRGFLVAVCDGYECIGASGTHFWSFKLLMDVTYRHPKSMNLVNVSYGTTLVSAGNGSHFTGQEYVECGCMGGRWW